MFARSSPTAHISTLNIPESTMPALGIRDTQLSELLQNDQIGKFFKGKPEERSITQILGDSAEFDVSNHREAYDFIWVDACHSYENVKVDSAHAFEMVAPGGHVFWHDFDATQPGVTSALLEMAGSRELFWIGKTSIVGFKKEN